jgi:hypothetical protein
MNRYDWGWSHHYDRGYAPRRMRGYGSDFGRDPSPGWWGGPEGSWGWGGGYGRGWPAPRRGPGPQGGYDRGVYGGAYPGYGGYPGDVGRGMHYAPRGYDQGFQPRGGRPEQPGAWGRARGYDEDVGSERFLPPEPAYERHPDLEQARLDGMDGGWVSGEAEVGEELNDDDIRGLVRQNLSNDAWIDAERIEVQVNDQVVTLTGEVDDYLEARYAWDDAWEAVGVRGVVNKLTVRTEPAAEKKGEGGGKRKR